MIATGIHTPIIVALDFSTSAEALALASRLDPKLCRVKVGKELFTVAGPAVIEALQKQGFEVFLDLKYHDIPNTVAGACRAATSLGVWMLNVHAAGGQRMLEAAAEATRAATRAGAQKPILIAVTVLTSLSNAELPAVGLAPDAQAAALRYAALAQHAGLDGVVCSAEEAPAMKAAFGQAFQLVTPGIRLAEDAKADQSRVVTPVDAIRMGSDYLVIGRSVTASKDPVATMTSIYNSIKDQQQ